RTREVALFSAEKHGTEILKVDTVPWADAQEIVGDFLYEKTSEELELVEAAGDPYTDEAFYGGELSPVFWGSAMTNFGVEFLLRYMAEKAAPPSGRGAEDDTQIAPTDDRFTGFVFKIQANMNPRHRDRIAFMRVVSGRFERGMDVKIGRTGENLRMAKPHSFLAQERSIVETAFPGDIVGLYDSGKLRVGDTLAAGKPLKFNGIPRFAPEFFGQLLLEDPLKRKALDTGLEQLSHEGVIQLFYKSKDDRQNPYLGAVGVLQFEVLKERLKNEYNVSARFESVPMKSARWVGGSPEALAWLQKRRDYRLVYDRNFSPVLLVDNNYAIKFALENAPGLELYDIEPL
ncbi:MAG: EF-Tu/IF-2/RF-3 family GTPase, partial [Myxococcota bacterium]